MTAIYVVTPTDMARKIVLMFRRHRQHPFARAQIHRFISLHRRFKQGSEVFSLHSLCEADARQSVLPGICGAANG